MSYIGRFAPTPSGDLHFGSLVTALASYLEAKSCEGQWLLRIEDSDAPRVKSGSVDSIMTCLEGLGLYWDGFYRQSEHLTDYQDILQKLASEGHLYACQCSRAQLKARQLIGQAYDGHCRQLGISLETAHCAIRLKLPQTLEPITWQDALQGPQSMDLKQTTGDFILRRADQIPAYALVSVVDDYLQGVTHVVRGVDLLEPTAAQIHLRHPLGWPVPQYAHLPLAVTPQGLKLSKMSHAKAVNWRQPTQALRDALAFLKLPIHELDIGENRENHLNWAIGAWKMTRLKGLAAQVWAERTQD